MLPKGEIFGSQISLDIPKWSPYTPPVEKQCLININSIINSNWHHLEFDFSTFEGGLMNKVEILPASYSHVAGAKGLTRRNYFCRTMGKDIMLVTEGVWSAT
jgi:hypothetical protein